MAIIYHQTFSPSSCECVFEQEFDHNEETGLNGQPRFLFAHKICSKHEPLVKNKPKLSLSEWTKKRQDIAKHKEFLLKRNRDKHLKDFDEHPTRKEKREAIKEMKMLKDTEKHALRIEEQMQIEYDHQITFLDNHEDGSMSQMLTGLHSPYALIAQEVYDTIMQGG
jgi:hypothetical protein